MDRWINQEFDEDDQNTAAMSKKRQKRSWRFATLNTECKVAGNIILRMPYTEASEDKEDESYDECGDHDEDATSSVILTNSSIGYLFIIVCNNYMFLISIYMLRNH